MYMNQHLAAFQLSHSGLGKKSANQNKRSLPGYLMLKQFKKQKIRLTQKMKLHLA